MNALLEVISPGAMASVQDLGRPGLRRLGVPRAGALEGGWLRLANALAGNPEDAPAIEFLAGGLSVRACRLPLRVALAGHFSAEIVGAGERRRVSAWRSLTLAPGDSLRCGTPVVGRVGYLALAGMRVPQQFGSASTDVRAGLGGIDGRLLASGARLSGTPSGGRERVLRTPPAVDTEPIRVVLGPQDDYFDTPSLERFLSETYRVLPAADRMGMRLGGPVLRHRPEKGCDITSDATVPGSIQVPGQGLPIVLLADGQTAGGYAKIATVISADLPRLAVMAPGQPVRFAAVSVVVGELAARAREATQRALIAAIGELDEARSFDPQALYAANLVSGVVDAWPVDDEPGVRGPARTQGDGSPA